MNARSYSAVVLVKTFLLSSDTSTAVPTAVDLANYFPVGKREVKFLVAVTNPSTSLGAAATVTLQQSTSTSTTGFTNILAYDGSTLTFTSTVNASSAFETHGIVTQRYIRALYVGTTSTGTTLGVVVFALPMVRNA